MAALGTDGIASTKVIPPLGDSNKPPGENNCTAPRKSSFDSFNDEHHDI